MEVEPTANQNDEAATISDTLRLPPPPVAPVMHSNAAEKRLYWDRSHYQSPAEQMKALKQSSCLYIGNLAFTTRSHLIRSHCSRLGPVQRVVLGLDRVKKTPCGFCFVEYFERSAALRAVALLSGTKLDGNIIRVELDAGYQPGRQFGRGVGGGQVRDDRRNNSRKRSRDSGGGGDGGSSSTHTPQAAAAVSLDSALPSGRETTGHYGPSSTSNKTEEEDVEMENADAKRAKKEE